MKHKMKMDHKMMSKMDMGKMDMSKLSDECQAMMTKMKAKMAEKHKDGGMNADKKKHDMSKMKDHDMSKMKEDGSEEMKAKHKEMKAKMVEKHKEMKTKMAEKHKDGGMHADMKKHDMSKMKEDGSEKMKAMQAKHKKCMAEMKAAMPAEQ